jgi:hypothetical protein
MFLTNNSAAGAPFSQSSKAMSSFGAHQQNGLLISMDDVR